MRNFLFTADGKEYLLAEYVNNQRSTYDIAQDRGTYPNEVRRALKFHSIALRDKSLAQRAALSSGRHKHPTKGRQRSQKEREAISRSVKERNNA